MNNGATIVNTDNDTLTITESSTILDGQLTITGDININNDITVSGNSNIGAIGKTISIKGALDVDEEVLIKSTLNVIDDTNVSSFNSSGTTSLASSGIMTTIQGSLDVNESVEFNESLNVSGNTTVSTFSSTGATSIASSGGNVTIASGTGDITTIKGELTVDRATTIGWYGLDVYGDTSVSTFDSSGTTKIATDGGIVYISSPGLETTVKGRLTINEDVILDTSLDVSGNTSVYTLE